ncbi:hypothetical protein ABNF97_33240 [Plantactinospora sp. B6F1]|uniref:hypothetical protein n=1 Tax=Plantactinospora sp. B6F1 TaxID=3158971 RepID=UPI0032D8D78A
MTNAQVTGSVGVRTVSAFAGACRTVRETVVRYHGHPAREGHWRSTTSAPPGSEVCIQPDTLDLPGFLSLAEKLGGGVVYLKAEPFEPKHDDAIENPPEHLLKHRGKVGRVTVAFAVNGLVHFWEQEAPWYDEWQDSVNSAHSRFRFARGDLDDGPERLSDEERA